MSHLETGDGREQFTDTKHTVEDLVLRLNELFEKRNDNRALFLEMIQDEQVAEALVAAIRTLANVGISLVDVIPAIGDAVSVGADVLKVTKFDLTPDVSKGVAWGTEALELFTGGVIPSHAVETTLQLMKDYPRMAEGFKRAQEIWTAHQQAVESPEVQQAAGVFQQRESAQEAPPSSSGMPALNPIGA